MKTTPAVFFTSLAVSAISLTVPIPAATTVLDLFIGEDITAQHITEKNCKTRQQTTFETGGEKGLEEHNTSRDGGHSQGLRRQAEQPKYINVDSEAALSLLSNVSHYYARSKRIMHLLEGNLPAVNRCRSLVQL